jgi:uncharacterized protein
MRTGNPKPADRALVLSVGGGHSVSAILLRPLTASACFLIAPGAGAGLRHPFLESVAQELAHRHLATLRFQFPYLERGSRRPDPPELCHATVRTAVLEARHCAPELPLIAGGKSFGGRMTSQAQALAPLLGVRALVFLGFPLHPAGRPGLERARHLANVHIPMLFIQGTRDALAEPDLLRGVIEDLEGRATLHAIRDADHAFHVPARGPRTDAQVRAEMLDGLIAWLARVLK